MAISDERRRERLAALGVQRPSLKRTISTPDGEPRMSAVILDLLDLLP